MAGRAPFAVFWPSLFLFTLLALCMGFLWFPTPLLYQFSPLPSDPSGRHLVYRLFSATFYAGLPLLALGQLAAWISAFVGRRHTAIGLSLGSLLFMMALITLFLLAFELLI